MSAKPGECRRPVDIDEAARRLDIDRGTLRRCLEKGLVDGFRGDDGRWMVLLREEASGRGPAAGGNAPVGTAADSTGQALLERIDRLMTRLEQRQRALTEPNASGPDKDQVICELARQIVRLAESGARGSAPEASAGSPGRPAPERLQEQVERHERELRDVRDTVLLIRDFLVRHWSD